MNKRLFCRTRNLNKVEFFTMTHSFSKTFSTMKKMIHLIKPYNWLVVWFVFGCLSVHDLKAQSRQKKNDLKIWFDRPAFNWNEALPVGNGRLGAMVFGGVTNERLQLNEETVWTGNRSDFFNPQSKTALPEVRRLLFAGKYAEAQALAQEKLMGEKKVGSSYQTLGDLWLNFTHERGDISDYQRELNIDSAIAKVAYRSGRVMYTREIFSSAPDKALVIRLMADKQGALTLDALVSRPGNKAQITVTNNEIVMTEHTGNGVGVRLVARAKVLIDGGTLQIKENGLHIEKANTVTVYLTAATDYKNADPNAVTAGQLAAVEKRSYDDIKSDHVADYRHFFSRVDLDLGTTEAVYFPTNSRITAMQSGTVDPQLISLYYQFGRYLLISSSRPDDLLPANLQGIWADGLNPPWDADYHININIQMNYWPAEMTNLSELHLPFLQFVNNLRPDGRKTANDMYGLKGAVAHFTTDAWHFTETYGKTQWAMWPMGMAWSAQHLWEHYLFTEDKKYLAGIAYPAMKEAAEFCVNWLVENPQTKQLVSGPSISPENTFKTRNGEIATMVMGPTMDHMIIRDLLSNTIDASVVLNTDAAFRKKMQSVLSRLAPTRIGSDGRIMEWTEEFEEPEPGHRHISHLFGLHPGRQITKNNPELLEAARKTIAYRLAHGGGHTGWSRAWIINFFARLQDGEAAYENLLALLRKSTLPNLFDTHPPFQIDGNFGATAGITEMLLQSHAGEIDVLPALPAAWLKGHVHGLVARGGFEVNIDWDGGKLKTLSILSRLGNKCRIRYGNKILAVDTEKGKTYTFDHTLVQHASSALPETESK
jgi:alpha-L-fucosidase 2